jgi:outer membrane protein assembly factor BamA
MGRVENLSGDTTNIPIDILRETGDDNQFERAINTLTLGVQRDRRDNRLFPTEGYYLRGSNRTAAKSLGGDVNFYNPELDARSYIPFLGPTFWAGRFNYQTLDTWDEESTLPSFEKFFLGGNRTVRGYDFRDILIYDSDGDRVSGGNTAFFANLEYRYKVMEQTMQLFAFTDVGAVYRDTWQLGTDRLKQSAGVGLRVRSPMGPINISWSRRLDNTAPGPPDDSGETQIDFNIGTGF